MPTSLKVNCRKAAREAALGRYTREAIVLADRLVKVVFGVGDVATVGILDRRNVAVFVHARIGIDGRGAAASVTVETVTPLVLSTAVRSPGTTGCSNSSVTVLSVRF